MCDGYTCKLQILGNGFKVKYNIFKLLYRMSLGKSIIVTR